MPFPTSTHTLAIEVAAGSGHAVGFANFTTLQENGVAQPVERLAGRSTQKLATRARNGCLPLPTFKRYLAKLGRHDRIENLGRTDPYGPITF